MRERNGKETRVTKKGSGEDEGERTGDGFRFVVLRVDAQLEFCISASLQIIQMYVNIRYNNRFSLSEKEA